MQQTYRFGIPDPLDFRKMRTEEDIREDLRKQLEAIYRKQQETWKCP
jgi:hypothetical protein